jgi:hypothetical protein
MFHIPQELEHHIQIKSDENFVDLSMWALNVFPTFIGKCQGELQFCHCISHPFRIWFIAGEHCIKYFW